MSKLVVPAGIALMSLFSVAHADEWKLFPVLAQDYQFKPAVALMAGQFDPVDGESSSVMGVELSLECPLLMPPTNHIRQQISLSKVDDDGLTVSSIEINPHYMFSLSPQFEAGFGPSLGLSNVEFEGDDANELTYGLGASARYNLTANLFLGAELRRAWMSDVTFNGVSGNVGNTRAAIKLGYQF